MFCHLRAGKLRLIANPGRVSRLVLSAAVLSAAIALAPAAHAFNPQTAGLQIVLRQQGLYRGAIDAVQGPKTRRAIRTFQRRHGLAVDGLAGPRTRAALGPRGSPLFGARAIQGGMTGYDVGVLQFLLARRGLPPGRLDARFGARTERAVRRFQRSVGLMPDGVVGRRTARMLCRLPVCTWRAAPRRRPAQVHRISPGETLTAISRRYGVSVQAIARVNRVDPRRIIIAGARLRIPGAAARMAMTEPFAVRAALDYWSRRYGVDPRLVRAVAWFESGFNNTLVSPAGARGVMQVTPATWDYVELVLVGRQIPHTLSGNVQVGVAFLHQLLHEFRDDVRLALAAYVQGPRSVRTRGLLIEAKHYVAGVLALRRRI
jgi:peptidoglycan hydrolase-like protein with peptidoglycan-binding domain